MTGFTVSPISANPCEEGRTPYPQIFRRTFEYGHPDEFIEIWLDNYGQVIHNLITLEAFQAYQQICDRETESRTGRLEFDQARCLSCAKKAKEEDNKDPRVRLKGSIGAYQAGTSSTFVGRSDATPRNGFDNVLEGCKSQEDQDLCRNSRLRVPEEDHRSHRLQVQAEAVLSPGKWLAVPTRRLWNVPIQTAGKVEMEAHHRAASHSLETEDINFLQSNISAVCKNICHGESDSARSAASSNSWNDNRICSFSSGSEGEEDKGTKDSINMKTDDSRMKKLN